VLNGGCSSIVLYLYLFSGDLYRMFLSTFYRTTFIVAAPLVATFCAENVL